jgi:hypothetical protein
MSYEPHPFHVTYTDARGSQQNVLRSGQNFRLGLDAIARYFLVEPSLPLMDLLRIGMAVFVVDRHVRRRQATHRRWSREIQVKIEVVRPDFWAGGEVHSALQEAADFVTGDAWDFEFEKGPTHYEWTAPLFWRGTSHESPLVCLYSGGLDSAAGLGLRLREQEDRPILPVTIHHQPGQRNRVARQFRRLKRHFSATIEPLGVKARVCRSGLGKPEPSGRGRSVLFTALGAVAADLAGAHEIEVFESGVGAMNVPLMAGMTGSMSTRSSVAFARPAYSGGRR